LHYFHLHYFNFHDYETSQTGPHTKINAKKKQKKNRPITYSGTFSVTSGLGSLSLYGWSTSPLVEYYVMETNVGISMSGATNMGTVTSDGGTYTIYLAQRVNQPSIVGTATFYQFISVRQSPRTSGTVTIANHFAAWSSHGMNLGTLNYQVIAVESWSGSGSATQSVSNTGAGTGTGGGTGTGTGTCAALYGQCGGTGWTGATCCASGTCKYSNAWYSQCL
jgi:endo-1,4-beta-xylanase